MAHGVTAPSHLGRRSGRMYKGRNSTSYRYIGRSQRVLDVSTPPWIVLRVHFHAMMSSGACDMMCYPQREPPCERAERGHRRSFLVQLGGSYMTSRYMCRAYHVSDVSTPPWIVQRVHPHAKIIFRRPRSEDPTTHERCRERAESGHRRSFFVYLSGSYMTSRYMCRAYHVSDVSKPPWIVQRLHRHAMMSSGARDMIRYLQRKPCYA